MEQVVITKLDDLNFGEYIGAEVVIDHGSYFEKSVLFFIAREHQVKTFPKREEFEKYVARMGRATIARCGDARNPLPTEIVEGSYQ